LGFSLLGFLSSSVFNASELSVKIMGPKNLAVTDAISSKEDGLMDGEWR